MGRDPVTNPLSVVVRNDSLVRNGGSTAIYKGTIGVDHINATDGDDSIYGDAGNDVLYGRAGKDLIDGGKGADDMTGGILRDGSRTRSG